MRFFLTEFCVKESSTAADGPRAKTLVEGSAPGPKSLIPEPSAQGPKDCLADAFPSGDFAYYICRPVLFLFLIAIIVLSAMHYSSSF